MLTCLNPEAKGHCASGRLSSFEVNEQGPQELRAPAEESFPLHAMRIPDLLALIRLTPHNELVAKGLVVPLRACVIFRQSPPPPGGKLASPRSPHTQT